jgi:hypothetical protein
LCDADGLGELFGSNEQVHAEISFGQEGDVPLPVWVVEG